MELFFICFRFKDKSVWCQLLVDFFFGIQTKYPYRPFFKYPFGGIECLEKFSLYLKLKKKSKKGGE